MHPKKLVVPFIAALALTAIILSPTQSLAVNPFDTAQYSDARRGVGAPRETIAADHSGAFVYSYELELPPGRGGDTPHLALAYSSANTKNANLAGYGWSLSIPEITRLNKRGVNLLYGSAEFSSTVSGELVPITLTDGEHGTYGARVETGDFYAYTFHSDNTWTMRDKFGTLYTFGRDSASRVADSANPGRTFSWGLSEEKKLNGNAIAYAYRTDSGVRYPDWIRYTDYIGAGATVHGMVTVHFDYETRPDQWYNFEAGFETRTRDRLREIRVDVALVSGVVEWVKKYTLGYSTGDNTARSMLASITETGRDELSGAETGLPATAFAYSTSTPSFTQSPTFTNSLRRFIAPFSSTYHEGRDGGLRLVDANRDGLPEIYWGWDIYGSTSNCYGHGAPYEPNQGEWGWNTGTGWTEPTAQTHSIPVIQSGIFNGADTGRRKLDVNGDGLLEFVCSLEYTNNTTNIYDNTTAYTDPITGASVLLTGQIPSPFVRFNGSSGDMNIYSLFYGDFTGDGLLDFVSSAGSGVYYNTGTYTDWWQNTEVMSGPSLPPLFSGYPNSPSIFDVNADGLADVLWHLSLSPHLNTGSTSTFQLFPDAYTATSTIFRNDSQVAIADLNGDGLVDLFTLGSEAQQNVYLNTGVGDTGSAMKGWRRVSGYSLPNEPIRNSLGHDNGVRFDDVNGDGLTDILVYRRLDEYYNPDYTNRYVNNIPVPYPTGSYVAGVYLHNGRKPDLLTGIRSASGSETTIAYGRTTQFPNPSLYTPLDVVTEITVNDGLGNLNRTAYSYEGGKWRYDSAQERKFAGFAIVTKTANATRVAKTYFHQGDASDAALGEYNDSWSKIGRPYRVEITDASGALSQEIITRYDEVNLGPNRNFVKKTQAVTRNFDTGGNTHVDTAESFIYDNMSGNVLERIQWGEVNGNPDGTFTDIGTDKYRDILTYATFTGGGLCALVQTKDSEYGVPGVTFSYTRYFYDNLPRGSASLGRLTREQRQSATSVWHNEDKTYNSLGLVTSAADPNGRVTNYTYDANNLFPVSVTNALGHVTTYEYDRSSGKPRVIINPNGKRTEVVFDGLDRVMTTSESNGENPSATELVSRVSYTDTGLPRVVKKVMYATSDDDALSFEEYAYLDGLNRVIQTKSKADDGLWQTVDTRYDNFGRKMNDSLPYHASSFANSLASADTALQTTYAYDLKDRLTTATDILGITANTYLGWTATTTDYLGNAKGYKKDAHGRLTAVTEQNGASFYRTAYTYGGHNKLTRITDALGNRRGFTYDLLSRQTRAPELYTTGDTTTAETTYVYDAAGNLVSETQPTGAIVTYAYDALNRVTNENIAGESGPRITYAYDACEYGIGRLCAVTTGDATTSYAYDITGRIATETKVVDGVPYTSHYAYDRQGNIRSVNTSFTDGSVNYASETTIVYAPGGRISTITENGAPIVTNVSYAPNNQPTVINFGNGTVSTRTHDPGARYRLTGKSLSGASGATIWSETYAYDAVGNITSIANTSPNNLAKTASYAYDPLYRLLSATITNTPNNTNYTEAYAYNAVGNITTGPKGTYRYQGNTISGSFANPHAVTSIVSGGTTTDLVYDPNGNLTDNGNGLALAFDYKSRLVATRKATDTASTTYAYDHENARVRLAKPTGETTVYPNNYLEVTRTPSNAVAEAGGNIEVVKHLWLGSEEVSEIRTSFAEETETGSACASECEAVTHTIYADNQSNTGVFTFRWSATSTYTAIPDNDLSYQIEETTGTTIPWTLMQTSYQTVSTPSGATVSGVSVAPPITGGNIQVLSFSADKNVQVTDGVDLQTARLTLQTNNLSNLATVRLRVNRSGSVAQPVRGFFTYTPTTSLFAEYLPRNYGNQHVNLQTTGETVSQAVLGSANWLSAESYGVNVNFASTQSYTGTTGIEARYTLASGILKLTQPNTDTTGSTHLRLAFKSDTPNPSLTVSVYDNAGAVLGSVNPTAYISSGSITGNTWYEVSIPLADINAGNTIISGLGLGRGEAGVAWFDDIRLVNVTPPLPAAQTTTAFVGTDHLGGLGVLTDEAGNPIEFTDYFPYGKIRTDEKTGSFQSNRKYIGQYYDEETELSYLTARYYAGGVGMFLGRDPVYLVIGNPNRIWKFIGYDQQTLLSDPQILNAYSYARNNPINRSDPFGLFNLKTGAVEKGDTLRAITSQLNKTYGTNYSVSTIATLNNISNQNQIYVGQTIMPNQRVPDVTKPTQTVIRVGASDQSLRTPGGFYSGVRTGGTYDVKNTVPIFSTKNHDAFVFEGEKIRKDAPGNIIFGYVGSAVANDVSWLSQGALVPGASLYQTYGNFMRGNFRIGDNPGDAGYIQQGINLYNSNYLK